MLGVVTAVLLALPAAAAGQDPPEGSGTDAGAQQTGTVRLPQAPWPSDPRGTRQEVALAFHATTFWSREASHYTFYSLGLGYLRSSGSLGPFIHATAFLPLQARQDGNIHAAGNIAGRRIGGDLLIGVQKRWYPSSRSEAEFGPGFHMTAIWMPGATGYSDFSAMPLGVGAEAAIRWRTGAHIGRSVLRMGEFLNAGVDFYDPLRSNDLRNGFTFVVGMSFGLDDS